MIVVSDSTPLITLMKADKLDILCDLFGEVLIPESVFSEVTTNESFKNEADLIINNEYIRVVEVRNKSQVSFLQRATGLDLGESEAIIYADEEKADLLLMDELAGRTRSSGPRNCADRSGAETKSCRIDVLQESGKPWKYWLSGFSLFYTLASNGILSGSSF